MTENIDPKDARQGRQGKQVLTVLVVGLALMGLAYIVVELIWR